MDWKRFFEPVRKHKWSYIIITIMIFILSALGTSFIAGCIGSCPPDHNEALAFITFLPLAFLMLFILYAIIASLILFIQYKRK